MEKRKRTSFNLIPLANQGESPGQPKRSLRVATTVRFNYKRDWTRVPNLKSRSARQRGGVKLVVHIAVVSAAVESSKVGLLFKDFAYLMTCYH
jgi:hypothetical protein